MFLANHRLRRLAVVSVTNNCDRQQLHPLTPSVIFPELGQFTSPVEDTFNDTRDSLSQDKTNDNFNASHIHYDDKSLSNQLGYTCRESIVSQPATDSYSPHRHSDNQSHNNHLCRGSELVQDKNMPMTRFRKGSQRKKGARQGCWPHRVRLALKSNISSARLYLSAQIADHQDAAKAQLDFDRLDSCRTHSL